MSPRISVVIPCFNGGRYLAAAVTSVRQQTRPAHEIIIVDDGSTDDSVAVARALGDDVRVLTAPHAGAGPARNLGARAARGDHLAFLDADDLWTENKLAAQLRVLADRPEVALVFGLVEEFHSEELDGSARDHVLLRPGEHNGFLPGALLLRTADFFRVGELAAGFRVGEFLEWYLRAREAGLVSAVVPEVVLRRRVHETNLGIRERQARGDYVQVLKQSLDRRRAAAASGAAAQLPPGKDDPKGPARE